MKFTTLSICLLYTIGTVIAAPQTYDSDPEAAASRKIKGWQRQYNRYIEDTIKTRYSGCTKDNIIYRQEWGSLSRQARIDYTNAVKCLYRKPNLSSLLDVPGARNRYDDFVATHIMHTPKVHYSGLFFFFHRYLIWVYEKALREECGYKGTQPYWDWTLHWQDPRKSPVFDGSATSMGGNGESIPHAPTNLSAFGFELTIPPATGGGCVNSGPFSNFTVNLGPVAFEPKGPNGGLGYNPRCLRRDISLEFSKLTKPTDVTTLLESCQDLECLDRRMEDLQGLHSVGHFVVGNLMMDAWASTGDPVFWLHHANVDRVWGIWQNLNPKNRTFQVYGTGTGFNNPPTPNVTLDTEMEFTPVAGRQSVRSLTSSIDGPLCYVYV